MITAEDVERILGPRPWKSRGDELLEANAAIAEAEKTKKKRAPRKKKTETQPETEVNTQTTDNNEETTA